MRSRALTIFGITGQTGSALAQAALERGWSVRGLARPQSRQSLPMEGPIAVIRGHFSDTARVADAIAGAEAVCCVIGPRLPYTDAFCTEATAAILAGMRHGTVRRIVCQTGAMIGAGNRTLPFQWLSALVHRRQPGVAADRLEQERLIVNSGLAWTLVKPPRLTNAPCRRTVQAGPQLRVGLLSSVARTSLAHFLLDAVDRHDLVGARVFVKQ